MCGGAGFFTGVCGSLWGHWSPLAVPVWLGAFVRTWGGQRRRGCRDRFVIAVFFWVVLRGGGLWEGLKVGGLQQCRGLVLHLTCDHGRPTRGMEDGDDATAAAARARARQVLARYAQ